MCKCYKVSVTVSVYKYTCVMFNCNVSCDYVCVHVYGTYNAVCVLHVQCAHSVCCAPYVYIYILGCIS